jgi:hypothetical protein
MKAGSHVATQFVYQLLAADNVSGVLWFINAN